VKATLVVPCFNEGHRWSGNYWDELVRVADANWIFVNDGSSDRTADLIDDLTAYPNVRAINFASNQGKGEAIRNGLLEAFSWSRASGGCIGFMDADGAFHRDDVARLLDEFDRLSDEDIFDALWSSRVALAGREIHRSRSRHYVGRAVATVMSIGYDDLPYDTQSGLKLFRLSEELQSCLARAFDTRWMFEIELIIRWRNLTGIPMRIREEPLEYWRDVAGSSISRREALRIIRELIRVKRLQGARNPRSA